MPLFPTAFPPCTYKEIFTEPLSGVRNSCHRQPLNYNVGAGAFPGSTTHFIDKETEIQGAKTIFTRSYSKLVAEFKYRALIPSPGLFTQMLLVCCYSSGLQTNKRIKITWWFEMQMTGPNPQRLFHYSWGLEISIFKNFSK